MFSSLRSTPIQSKHRLSKVTSAILGSSSLVVHDDMNALYLYDVDPCCICVGWSLGVATGYMRAGLEWGMRAMMARFSSLFLARTLSLTFHPVLSVQSPALCPTIVKRQGPVVNKRQNVLTIINIWVACARGERLSRRSRTRRRTLVLVVVVGPRCSLRFSSSEVHCDGIAGRSHCSTQLHFRSFRKLSSYRNSALAA
ncbi:hypothetical protein CPC08DRAFT_730098 [Agrocybe pediades]|nr:hypothetical protein CPC08DRAFT_730098 [Agrocybe pediades]